MHGDGTEKWDRIKRFKGIGSGGNTFKIMLIVLQGSAFTFDLICTATTSLASFISSFLFLSIYTLIKKDTAIAKIMGTKDG
jgi:hypothetical protein